MLGPSWKCPRYQIGQDIQHQSIHSLPAVGSLLIGEVINIDIIGYEIILVECVNLRVAQSVTTLPVKRSGS
jgi:hypothetical protein